MRQKVVAALAMLTLFFASGLLAAEQELLPPSAATVVIGLGESVRLDLPGGGKVHVSDGGIVRTRPIGRSLILTGQRIGRTTLRVLATTHASTLDRTLFVTGRRSATTARRFAEQIADMRGLALRFDSLPDLVVTGELLRISDYRDLAATAKVSETPWRFQARLLPSLVAPMRALLTRELDRAAWPGQALDVGPAGIALWGGRDSEKLSAEQRKLVQHLGIPMQLSHGLTELEPMVRTRIVLAEVRRSRIKKLGIRWPAAAEASLLPALQLPFAGGTSPLTLMLEALEEQGDGRILAMPTLLCRSGGEAQFLAGGEIPIKISTVRTSHVEWKKYGIQLNVQPQADRRKRMKFKLTTEISTLDGASAADGVPGLLTNRIETQFNLQGSQTIVLSGLIKREESQGTRGLPGLQSIPILGSLFSSEDFRRHLTELVVFVTPEVVSPAGEEEM